MVCYARLIENVEDLVGGVADLSNTVSEVRHVESLHQGDELRNRFALLGSKR